VLRRLTGAALAFLHPLARGQNHIDQSNLRKLCKHLPRFIAEFGLVTAGRERLPQHIGQKAHQDVCPHTMLLVVPYRPDLWFGPTSVQFKGEINDALPRKRHQKRHLESCNAYLLSRRSGVLRWSCASSNMRFSGAR
jgi:hypothetical protein